MNARWLIFTSVLFATEVNWFWFIAGVVGMFAVAFVNFLVEDVVAVIGLVVAVKLLFWALSKTTIITAGELGVKIEDYKDFVQEKRRELKRGAVNLQSEEIRQNVFTAFIVMAVAVALVVLRDYACNFVSLSADSTLRKLCINQEPVVVTQENVQEIIPKEDETLGLQQNASGAQNASNATDPAKSATDDPVNTPEVKSEVDAFLADPKARVQYFDQVIQELFVAKRQISWWSNLKISWRYYPESSYDEIIDKIPEISEDISDHDAFTKSLNRTERVKVGVVDYSDNRGRRETKITQYVENGVITSEYINVPEFFAKYSNDARYNTFQAVFNQYFIENHLVKVFKMKRSNDTTFPSLERYFKIEAERQGKPPVKSIEGKSSTGERIAMYLHQKEAIKNADKQEETLECDKIVFRHLVDSFVIFSVFSREKVE